MKKIEKPEKIYNFLEVKKQKIITKPISEIQNVSKVLKNPKNQLSPPKINEDHETNSQTNVPILETMQLVEETPQKKLIYQTRQNS